MYYKVTIEVGHMGAGKSKELVRYLEAESPVDIMGKLKHFPGLKSKGTAKGISLVKPISREEYEKAMGNRQGKRVKNAFKSGE